jgi:glycosyltransferase involved in cell wall biosynthesis
MLTVHRVRGTWRNKVDRYIALTQFSRNKLIQGGLPGEKIVVKPNFVYPDPGRGDGAGGYAIYVGRLSAEKGIDVLLHAWRDSAIPLKIVGDGPLAGKVRKASGKCIEWLGSKSLDEVYALIGAATFLVLPSECYENFPRVVIEAFAKGTPVIASRLGAMAEIVDHGRTGFHFTAGDGASLAATIRQALSMPVEDRARMRQAARQDYEGKYSAEENHRSLMAIYEQALAAPTKNGCIPVGGRA